MTRTLTSQRAKEKYFFYSPEIPQHASLILLMRFLERLAFVLCLVVATTGLFYWYWITTPSYALSQLVAAFIHQDQETFEKYVDIESITYKAIDDVIHSPIHGSSIFHNNSNTVGVGIISLFQPEIADLARAHIFTIINNNEFIRRGVSGTGTTRKSHHKISKKQSSLFTIVSNIKNKQPVLTIPTNISQDSIHPGTNNGLSTSFLHYATQAKQQLRAYGISREGFRGIDYINTKGQNALIGLKFHSPKLNRDFIVEFKMENLNGYWRIVELSNLKDLMSIYLETRNQIMQSSAM